MSFATVQDYISRYGSVTDTAMLQECLDDCSALMESEMDARGIAYIDPSTSFADRLMRVCRSMAQRIMPAEEDGSDIPVGATQMSIGAGGYTQSFTLGATYGTPKMLASEMRMLGIGARVGFGALAGRDDD